MSHSRKSPFIPALSPGVPREREIGRFDLARLRTALKPFRLHWFPTLRSTSNHAAVMRRRSSLFAPAIVLTGRQTAGRGRGSNSWWSNGGVLTVTFVLPTNDHLAPHQVPLLAGLAIRNAVAQIAPTQNIQLKWPNDLLCGEKKMAGLLCERLGNIDLIGVGLNINLTSRQIPRELQDRVTALSLLTGQRLDPNQVLTLLAGHLHAMLSQPHGQLFPMLLREYDSHHALIGRRVTVTGAADELPITGKVQGLDSMGRLLLRDGKTLYQVVAGQVKLLPLPPGAGIESRNPAPMAIRSKSKAGVGRTGRNSPRRATV